MRACPKTTPKEAKAQTKPKVRRQTKTPLINQSLHTAKTKEAAKVPLNKESAFEFWGSSPAIPCPFADIMCIPPKDYLPDLSLLFAFPYTYSLFI